ncbi:ABC transporter permease (plasmid) [Deltaproteobacteria bacterium Smac51]|nr:ABC transporter permease [Deltaproteobacteria bacterium Smac51]
MTTRLLSLGIGLIALGLWQAATDGLGLVSPLLLPSPAATCSYLIDSIMDGLFPGALLVTIKRLMTGYGLGLTLGLIMGLMLSVSPVARGTLGLTALGLQTLPSVCWAPLAILWFGQTEAAMYFVVVMGSVWAVAMATENAVSSVPPIYARAAQVMGSRGWHTWRTVILPMALPGLLSGAKLGWAFAWRSLMAAEIYVTIIRRFGLGQLLHFGRELNAMEQVAAVMIVIIAVGLITDRLLFRPIERYLKRTRGL